LARSRALASGEPTLIDASGVGTGLSTERPASEQPSGNRTPRNTVDWLQSKQTQRSPGAQAEPIGVQMLSGGQSSRVLQGVEHAPSEQIEPAEHSPSSWQPGLHADSLQNECGRQSSFVRQPG
jgi:hypothetical protein